MDLIGTTLGQYHIVEAIGHGGMASVFKARQPTLDRDVAVKVLLPHQAATPEFRERFIREAKAIAQLNHPNILPVIDYGQEDDLNYIVMKYVASGTLADRLKRPIDLAATTNLIGQIAAALDHAHQRGIIHRDVKPSNVLLDDNEWVQLADFGLAKLLAGDQMLTSSGLSMGTPAYLSPEQGQGETIDRHADIYSLGVMLYEMVTGRLPFTAETPMGVIIKHIYELPLAPRALNPAIPEALETVMLKGLAKPIEQRYHSAGELARALQQAVASAPSVVLAPTIGLDSNATPLLSPRQSPPTPIVVSNRVLFEETTPAVPHFIGREVELTAYGARLERDRFVVITGMAGMGKTTLGAKLARDVAVEPDRIFWFTFDHVEKSNTDALYWAIAAFLENRGNVSLAHYLRGEIGAQKPLERTARLNLLIAALAGGDYVLCFDDFQIAADAPEVAYFFQQIRQRFVDVRQPLPARIIIMGRAVSPDMEHLVSESLHGLTLEATPQFLLDRNVALAPEHLQQLWRHTAGNPMLLELSAGALVDVSAEAAGNFVNTLLRRGDIRDYLLHNIYQALTPAEQVVMRALAVFPGPIDRSGVEELLSDDDLGSIAHQLDALANKHVLDLTPDDQIDCHDLVREYCYHILSRRDRDRFHERAARYFEQEKNWLAAAYHHLERRETARALDLLVAHADDIINSGGVAALSQQLSRFTTATLTPDQRQALYKTQGYSLRIRGEHQQAIIAYQAALEQAVTDADRADLLHRLVGLAVATGDYERALELARQSLQVGEAGNQLDVIASAHNDLGMAHMYLGHLDKARQHLLIGQQIAGRLSAKKLLAENALELGLTAWKERNLDEARAYFETSRQLFHDIADRKNEALALGNLGLICGEVNDGRRQVAYYQQAVDIHRQIGDIDGLQIAYNNLGYLYLSQENYAAAVENYTALAGLARTSENTLMRSLADAGLADAFLGSGAVHQALSYALSALRLSEEAANRMAQGICQRTLGDVWLALGDAAQAKASYEQSIPILEEFNEEHDLTKARQGVDIAVSRLAT
jgi:tetratricopeptide (TPR) repeat protein/tRNA A-37 threonylcarbamoyl transferase component Bud32